MFFQRKSREMPAREDALPGRDAPIPTVETHFVLDRPLMGPYPDTARKVVFGLGCFWGAERMFWKLDGVWITAVGYAAGYTPNPTYEEVCSGKTGHNEVVLVVYEPEKISLDALLKVFWEGHDPTQGMRQGNDSGTQYRSGIYLEDADERAAAEASRTDYAKRLAKSGYGDVTTEILPMPEFYFAEGYHQQYLAKNPGGYCGIGGTGVTCQTGAPVTAG